MKILIAVLMLGSPAMAGVRILKAAPDDNVLVEISTPQPASLWASTDLVTWKPIFFYVAPCDGFKAALPQLQRGKTYYRLGPVQPELSAVVLRQEIPDIVGKEFGSLNRSISFSAGGVGTYNPTSFEQDRGFNSTYSILDSQPGMISIRSVIADGTKVDHLMFLLDRDAPANAGSFDALIFTTERAGDWRSEMTTTSWQPHSSESEIKFEIGQERPPEIPEWPVGEGWVINSGGATITLQNAGVASIKTGASTESATYEYTATGYRRATVLLSRLDGSRTLIHLHVDGGHAYHRNPAAEPYLISGSGPVSYHFPPEDED